VRFTSDQVNVTLDSTGKPSQGSESITELVDLWTFEKTLKSKDPVWRLGAARSG
jgi:predicted lipid-binding transport protein (Tim44 family)